MRIQPIVDRPDLIDIVARWQFDEWGHRELDGSLDVLVDALRRQAASPDSIAITFVAMDGDVPIGTASVVEQTAKVYRASPRQRDLSPWLASVYVRPKYRGRGVATALVRHVTAHVASSGVARFYLFTDGTRGLYEACGWQVIGIDQHGGREMTIMAIDTCTAT